MKNIISILSSLFCVTGFDEIEDNNIENNNLIFKNDEEYINKLDYIIKIILIVFYFFASFWFFLSIFLDTMKFAIPCRIIMAITFLIAAFMSIWDAKRFGQNS